MNITQILFDLLPKLVTLIITFSKNAPKIDIQAMAQSLEPQLQQLVEETAEKGVIVLNDDIKDRIEALVRSRVTRKTVTADKYATIRSQMSAKQSRLLKEFWEQVEKGLEEGSIVQIEHGQ